MIKRTPKHRLGPWLVAAALACTSASALADDTRPGRDGYERGMHPGMMGGYGGGPGMMGGYGGGPGMMGGYGMGPGMMGGYGMGPGMMGGCGMGPGMMGGYGMGMGPGMMGGYRGGISLDADQRAKINAISDETRKQHWTMMGAMMDEQSKLRDLYESAKPDSEAIAEAYKRIGDIQQSMYRSMIEAQRKMDAVLTDEQRAKMHQGWR